MIKIGMSVNTNGLKKGLSDGRDSLTSFTGAVNFSGKALTALAAKAAVVLGPIIALNQVFGAVKEQLSEVGETNRLAQRIGSTAEQLSGLQYAAKVSGIESDKLTDALSDMTEKLGDARMGGGEGAEVLDKLGLSVDELAGKDPSEVFKTIAGEISKLDNQADKLTLADKMFGGVGQELIPLIDQGEAGINKLQARAKELGVSFDSVDAAKVSMANQAMTELKTVLTGVYRQLAIGVAPIITAVAKKFTEAGTSGFNFADVVKQAMKQSASAIGVAADILDVFHDGWHFLKAGVVFNAAAMLKMFSYLGKGLQELINLIPGVEVSFGDAMQSMSEEVDKLAKQTWKDAKTEFMKPPPSVGIKKFFDEIEQEAIKTAANLKENNPATSIIETNSEAVELIKTLQRQNEVMRIGERQTKLNELAQAGVSQPLIEQIKKLHKQNDVMTKQQEIAEKVKSIIEDTKSPLDKFNESLKELNQFKADGLIDDQQYKKALAKLRKEMGSTQMPQMASLAEQGSREARDSIVRHRFGSGDDPMKSLDRTNKEQLAIHKATLPLLRKMARDKPQELVAI